MLVLGLPLAAVAEQTGTLHITVVLTDADGRATPIPRVVLLISQNPASAEPRRVRTGADGSVTIALPPGNYTVESDVPVALGGQGYQWTQIVDVASGAKADLSLTSSNAEIATDAGGDRGAAPVRADAAVIFNNWRHSIVQVWTPTTHASGFVIDPRGLIATNEPAIGEATNVEVEFGDFKIAGRVVATDRRQGVAIIWVDPAAIASIPAIRPDCSAPPGALPAFDQRVVTIVAPMLEPKNAIPGTVARVDAPVFSVDWRLTGGMAGGPVFDAEGHPIGITLPDEERTDSRRTDSQAVPFSNACSVIAAAEKRMAGATPPPGTRLRIEERVTRSRKPVDPKAPRQTAPTLSSASFDLTLLTPAMADTDPSRWSPRTDFGNWTAYVNDAPPVLLVRVTPQFEESLWKTIARGAAQTQGIALPPLKSFTSNFLRLRAFCGDTEVMPIHPFHIVREVAQKATIREGLYVFAVGDFGAHCATVRFDLYSEKSPDKADSRTVDPKLFTQITSR